MFVTFERPCASKEISPVYLRKESPMVITFERPVELKDEVLAPVEEIIADG